MPIICLMVRENHKMVREISGKSQGILWGLMAGHPDHNYQVGCVTCWKNIFGDFFDGSRISDRRHVNTTENAMSSTDIFISNWFDVCEWSNISKTMLIMKWTTRFIRFTGWIPLKYGSTTTPPIIAHCQKTPMSSLVFHIAIPQTSNISRTPSFYLLTDEFSKWVSIIRQFIYWRQDGIIHRQLLFHLGQQWLR